MKQGNLDTESDTQRENSVKAHREKIWGDVSTSPGMLRIAGEHQKLEEARKGSPQQPSERAWSC